MIMQRDDIETKAVSLAGRTVFRGTTYATIMITTCSLMIGQFVDTSTDKDWVQRAIKS